MKYYFIKVNNEIVYTFTKLHLTLAMFRRLCEQMPEAEIIWTVGRE